ncbi:TetR/AcrR family transcriptional regulator [Amycolatopsis sp. FDAARGOS 1241]|uniref:TetR/AcrR family transcriptional regulator n=1 Tax=Amycolatopsis sp. FDAARGOS 1241 TaxID=2778070 RepID=UPI001950A9B1|nr:TetR/AcrR family transcriptional regulator [Amycolatopsis sp. FDAARGOS 1241]QRP47939.1 TetR/AcrR family transcriptional regulator [Amycolatopsis sp. FDAARGOS 1241]
MPRQREFDEQDAIARAANLFHRRGYHATSTRDLGEALALHPSSLYRVFGDKHALFLRALDHYLASESARSAAALQESRPVRELLRDWLYSMVEPTVAPGCFVTHAATELGTDDPETVQRVHAAFESTTAAIATVLQDGITSGELRPDLDADATARVLFTTLTGLRVRHRAGHDACQLRATVDHALRVLG